LCKPLRYATGSGGTWIRLAKAMPLVVFAAFRRVE
jgi:hypothetical protein